MNDKTPRDLWMSSKLVDGLEKNLDDQSQRDLSKPIFRMSGLRHNLASKPAAASRSRVGDSIHSRQMGKSRPTSDGTEAGSCNAMPAPMTGSDTGVSSDIDERSKGVNSSNEDHNNSMYRSSHPAASLGSTVASSSRTIGSRYRGSLPKNRLMTFSPRTLHSVYNMRHMPLRKFDVRFGCPDVLFPLRCSRNAETIIESKFRRQGSSNCGSSWNGSIFWQRQFGAYRWQESDYEGDYSVNVRFSKAPMDVRPARCFAGLFA